MYFHWSVRTLTSVNWLDDIGVLLNKSNQNNKIKSNKNNQILVNFYKV